MDIATLQTAVRRATGLVGRKTRRAVNLTGCNGTTSTYTNSGGVGSMRLVQRFPVTPRRFRVRLRNYNTVTGTAQSNVTGKGLKVGLTSPASDGYESGNIKDGALTTLVASDFVIPGNGSWWTSPWFDNTTYTIPANRFVSFAYGYDAGASITFPRGVGQAWHATDLSLLTGSTTGPGTPMANTPMEMQVEYEWEGDERVALFVGDSITEGLGGQSSLGNIGAFSWPALWAARNNAVAINLGVSGAQSGNWVGETNRYWTRADLSAVVPDAVVLALGANDAFNSNSLATFQSNMISVAANARTLFGEQIPVFLANVTPRGLGASPEAIRLSYNNWLEALPLRALACFDFDAAVRDPADSTRLLGAPTANNIYNYDGTHFTRRGFNKLAQAAGRMVA